MIASRHGRYAGFDPSRPFFADDHGYSSLGVMLAVLLAMVLLAFSMQAYWVNSTAADIQSVADAGALAGANVVAKVTTFVAIIDAMSLAISLTAGAVAVLGMILSFIPYVGALGKALVSGSKTVNVKKNEFLAKEGIPFLNRLMIAVPFLVVANSTAVMVENSGTAADGSKIRYLGTAIPFPLTVEKPISGGADSSFDAGLAEVEKQADSSSGEVSGTDQYSSTMQQAWDSAYAAYCAEAGAKGWNIPGPEAWNFGDAITNYRQMWREKATDYAHQAAVAPESDHSRLMALAELYWVLESAPSASDPSVRLERLDEIDANGLSAGMLAGTLTGDYFSLNAFVGDAVAADAVALTFGLEKDSFDRWNVIARSFGRYLEMKQEIEKDVDRAADFAQTGLEKLKATLKELVGATRMGINPPGRNGVVCIVADPWKHEAHDWAGTLSGQTLVMNRRVAISAAAVVPGGDDLLGAAMNNLSSQGGAVSGGFDSILEFTQAGLTGFDAAIEWVKAEVEKKLRGITFLGLGEVLANKVGDMIDDFLADLGLTPAKLKSPVPVLVNTHRVASAAQGNSGAYSGALNKIALGFASTLLTAKGVFASPSLTANIGESLGNLVAELSGWLRSSTQGMIADLRDGVTMELDIIDIVGSSVSTALLSLSPAGGFGGSLMEALGLDESIKPWIDSLLRGVVPDQYEKIAMQIPIPIPPEWENVAVGSIDSATTELMGMASVFDNVSIGMEMW